MFGFQTFGKQMMRVASKSFNTQATKYSFSNTLSWSNMETQSLMLRAAPVPNLGLMNLMNLRQLIEKCNQQAQLEPNSSITVSDIVAKGISMCALMKNLTTIMTRLHQKTRPFL